MKKAASALLAVIMICICLTGAVSVSAEAEEPAEGTVLYETDFTGGIPEGFRIPKEYEGKVYAEDGFLYLDAVGREFTKVYLPESLDKYGNYEIPIHATMLQPRDSGRWGSIMYRIQDVKKGYPYMHMCFRYDSNASNGVEFAYRNEQNTWNVTSTGSVQGHTFSDGTLVLSDRFAL